MKFFKRFYVRFIQWFAHFLLNRTNTVLRHLIVLKGKDPDFLPPPPAPAPEPVRTQQKTLKVSPSSYGNDGAKHVIESRRKFEANQAKQKAALAAAKTPPARSASNYHN